MPAPLYAHVTRLRHELLAMHDEHADALFPRRAASRLAYFHESPPTPRIPPILHAKNDISADDERRILMEERCRDARSAGLGARLMPHAMPLLFSALPSADADYAAERRRESLLPRTLSRDAARHASFLFDRARAQLATREEQNMIAGDA